MLRGNDATLLASSLVRVYVCVCVLTHHLAGFLTSFLACVQA